MHTPLTSLEGDGFHIDNFNESRPFSSFLPGIAGEYGKPLWVFYANRGQCISSFGVRDRNGAMLEFHPANKAYALTSLYGFRTFLRLQTSGGPVLYEPFQPCPGEGVEQRLCIRPQEIEIEETHRSLGLRVRVVYFTLAGEKLPALVRCVTVENLGSAAIRAEVLDGLPQIVPYGLEEKLLKQMSRTMEAFAEIRYVDDSLPFYKLKVEPSDKPEVQWITGGFFTFTVQQGRAMPVIADPDLVFGQDTSLRTPAAFLREPQIEPGDGRQETMTGCAFAQLFLSLEPGASSVWESYFGQAPDWEAARDFRGRVLAQAQFSASKRDENTRLITQLGAKFALLAGPERLDPYTRQAFLDNTLRGGQPVVIDGPKGPRVFHTFTRKHGDMERDYNFFELAPTYWSQGNGNFRDVNQNRRSGNFIFPRIDASNVETFFNLIQLDGNNPLVIRSEKFSVSPAGLLDLREIWPHSHTPEWAQLLNQPFSPGQLMEALLASHDTADAARTRFDQVLGLADKIQDAAHGEGYWVDHWIYNLDLLESHAALYPDRLQSLLLERQDFTYFDNDHRVQPRARKYVLRKEGTVRQLHAVVQDAEKAALIARRKEWPNAMRAALGQGEIYRTTLLAKILNLMAIKACLLDPFGVGLEMEAEKPGWCDALNGLPGLIGSSTHEAFSLRRWIRFVRAAVLNHVGPAGAVLLADEVAALVREVSAILHQVDPQQFLPSWERLATLREHFRERTLMGVAGTETRLSGAEILQFLDVTDVVLERGLRKAVDEQGLPVSYFTHEIAGFEVLPPGPHAPQTDDAPGTVHVKAVRFQQKAVSAFLEGSVHALRALTDPAEAVTLYRAVRQSELFDEKLGMYRVNAPLDRESFEIGRSKIFSPGWLENESIFLHMHYKFMLETLRSGLAQEYFEDLKTGLVAFHKPEVYGRSPLENSSFIASSRFPDANAHGAGFVARLSGATAEWISMVLHMGLGATPFQLVDGALSFEPRPVLAAWLFTSAPAAGFGPDSFGFKLFGTTWIVYHNPKRRNTFGDDAVAPAEFTLQYTDGRVGRHEGRALPQALAAELRNGELSSLVIRLD